MCLGSEDDIENRMRRKRTAGTPELHPQDEPPSAEGDVRESRNSNAQSDLAGPTSQIPPDL